MRVHEFVNSKRQKFLPRGPISLARAKGRIISNEKGITPVFLLS